MVINKLRQFQDLGHQVQFLIGDFTGMIGDPSGRNATRPPLTDEQIQENARTYQAQVFKILDAEQDRDPVQLEVVERAGRAGHDPARGDATPSRACSSATISAKRFRGNQPISIHEFLYPLMQGYDSVAMKSDVELGGTDQKFNLLVGRELQKDWGQEPQVILTMPLLEGLDGVNKMSKSLGNYVGITEPANEIFGKLMSVSDTLMWRYIELLSFQPLEVVHKWRTEVEAGRNPRDIKVGFAKEIVERFHGKAAAEKAEADFKARFREGAMPEDIPEVTVAAGPDGIALPQLLKQAGPHGEHRGGAADDRAGRRAHRRRARRRQGAAFRGRRHRGAAGRQAQVRTRDAQIAVR